MLVWYKAFASNNIKAKFSSVFFYIKNLDPTLTLVVVMGSPMLMDPPPATSRKSYKTFTLVNYDSRVVIWGIFKSGTTLEL